MSTPDSFIAEVTEEFRRDKALLLWKKYGGILLAFLVLVILLTALWEFRKVRQERTARAGSAELVAAYAMDNPIEKLKNMHTYGKGYDLLGKLRAASLLAKKGEFSAAADLYDQIAASSWQNKAFSDFARLQSIALRIGSVPAEETLATLAPLSSMNSPFRGLAIEMRALVQFMKNDFVAARKSLDEIGNPPHSPRGIQERIQKMRDLLKDDLPLDLPNSSR